MSKLILHLDDEPAIREILALSLNEEGYRVISAATPEEAFAAIAQHRPDLIITDLQLNDGDGLEAIGRLRTQLPGVPIILLTGVLIDPRIARQSVATQVDAYLPKTVSLTRIFEEVRRLTAGAPPSP